ncbi:calcium:proton antiporter [Methylomagnum ishizawai]|uniref:calcium:proton antiporter n=1 Tax=Methylomagnum ishizawai TaxID=1760988 RepID=UPI001C32468A|nr:calcium/proton transporter [Methylomagnum ishizawai]BBL75310.1 ionic transporter y4hA [Methylomagnum ishizawai]
MRIASDFLSRHAYTLTCWLVWLAFILAPSLDPHRIGLGWTAAIALGVFAAMLGCVFTVVRHADHLADILGEPLGTLVLTLSATAIEVSLMLMIMLTGQQNPTLLRDTVFATLMVLLNGLVGLSLAAGGWRHLEQEFNLRGALSFLHLIAPLSLVLLVMPNYSRSSAGHTLAPQQEGFLGALCVLVYAGFLLLQTGRHRSLFDHPFNTQQNGFDDNLGEKPVHKLPAGPGDIARSAAGLLLSVVPIVLLAEHLGGFIDFGIETLHAPGALGGLVVSGLVLAPEGLGALRAALANRMQRAVNICLGSALSTIALTVPTVLIAASLSNHTLELGLEGIDPTLLYASLLVLLITLVSGRATILQGQAHLMLFVAYLFFIFYP